LTFLVFFVLSFSIFSCQCATPPLAGQLLYNTTNRAGLSTAFYMFLGIFGIMILYDFADFMRVLGRKKLQSIENCAILSLLYREKE
jgi:cytochrome c biogenesis protein CcdA